MPVARENDPNVVGWILTMQADIALQMGWEDVAQQHFLEGLVGDPHDLYLKRAYADLLLDQERYREVMALLKGDLNDTGILLRAAIAARRGGREDLFKAWRAQLESRFDEIRLRGGQPHGRYEARFQLEIMDNPVRAVELAKANWEQQKQARDTRNLFEAALAARDPEAAGPAINFLKEHHTQDVVLQRLVEQLEQMR